jgi:hypothetical protein
LVAGDPEREAGGILDPGQRVSRLRGSLVLPAVPADSRNDATVVLQDQASEVIGRLLPADALELYVGLGVA